MSSAINSAGSGCRASVPRSLAHGAVALLIAAVMADTWLVGGLIAPAVVTGDSMAPGLLGAHYRIECRDCGLDFDCDANCSTGSALCPGCGTSHAFAEATLLPAQRVWVDRTAFGWRAPKRWEAVVLRWPDAPDQLCVKRVVGLPGEVVSLAEGDVVVDGRVVIKPPRVQRALAVSVADPSTARARWRPEREGSWVWGDEWCEHPACRNGAIDWLVYHHADHAVGREETDPPIRDGSDYNPDESRRLNPVSDLVLRFEADGSPEDGCYVRARWRGDEFRVAIPLGSGSVRLSHNGSRKRAVQVGRKQNGPLEVELIVSDRRVVVSLSGKPALEYAFEPTPTETLEPAPVLAVGAAAPTLKVRRLEVLRDVYYTPGTREARQYRLGRDEYFVLGDNSPHSIDSRHWVQRGGVVAGMLLGPALTW